MSEESDSKTPKKSTPKLPSLKEAKSSVQIASGAEAKVLQEKFEESFRQQSAGSELKYEHIGGLKDHYKHKRIWSYFLMALMAWMVLFQTLVIWWVGNAGWDFTKYPYLLPALLVQNLAQIVGLAVFVVKGLFSNLGKVWE